MKLSLLGAIIGFLITVTAFIADYRLWNSIEDEADSNYED